jgi:thymidylate synthase (FAD)
MTVDSARDFVKRLIRSGHHSVIEHLGVTVHFICDRGISHELVRHRLASFSQESTRYANYSKEKFGKEITVIRPFFWDKNSSRYFAWVNAMEQAEKHYLQLIQLGARPEEARAVLPNSLKTELIMSCNFREWRHIFELRCSRAAHPQMRELLLPLLQEFSEKIPIIFDDLCEKFKEDIRESESWRAR